MRNLNKKMDRQLNLYHYMLGAIYSQKELMKRFHISQRMLQRDIKDLCDCGLLNVKYDRVQQTYVDAGEPVFDESARGRRRQHLIRLHRLGTLIVSLSRTDINEIDAHERWLKEIEDIKEYMETEEPEDADEIDLDPNEIPLPEFCDLRKEYYELFPDSNERTRQRDFDAMSSAGFYIYYSRKYKTFIYEYDPYAS